MKKLYAALMTAFDENGNIDEQGTREMVRYNIDVNQLDGLYVGGSTEFPIVKDTTPNMTNPRLYRTTKEIKA